MANNNVLQLPNDVLRDVLSFVGAERSLPLSWAKTQATIAKSSAESELYGIVRGTCGALGFSALAEDLGTEVFARLHMDATAAQGIIDRQGLSKVRHLDVSVLRLQEQLARDKVPLIKVPGPESNADMMTKHLLAEVIRRHTSRMSLEFRDGRSQKAADLQSIAARAPEEVACIYAPEWRPRKQRQQESRDKMLAVCDRYAERHGEMLGNLEEPTDSGRGCTSRHDDSFSHRAELREGLSTTLRTTGGRRRTLTDFCHCR